MKKIQIYN